jgi:phosphate transport system substrate-binding protein
MARRRVRLIPILTSMACAWMLSMQAMARDRVHVVGSSTLFPFAAAVAENFAAGGKWKAPVVESIGTGGGFKLFCAGLGEDTPDITDASRPMAAQEIAECARHGVGPVVGIRVGLDGMLLAGARGAPAFSLSREQIYLALARSVPRAGRLVTNPYRRWKDISPELPDVPIRVYGPAPNHGTRDAFIALAIAPACERRPEIRSLAVKDRQVYCQALREDGAWIDVSQDYAVLLRRLVADPQALGVLGFSFLMSNRGRIQAARVDGIDPTEQTISAWRYPLARPLFVYVKQAHMGRIPGLAAFLQEFVSDRAIGPGGYLVSRGLMALPAGQMKGEKAKVELLVQLARHNDLLRPAPRIGHIVAPGGTRR